MKNLYGKMITGGKIRDYFAGISGADFTKPITTGIFVSIVAWANYQRSEDENMNKFDLNFIKRSSRKIQENIVMKDKWLDYAIRIQSIAQAGIQYGKDKFDKERYTELRQIAAEMIATKTDIATDKVFNLFCNETGYQTPKVDTRAAIFIDGKILLVHENNGTWSLPGGWCDVDQSVASNIKKEVKEETGFNVSTKRIIAVQDWRKHNVTNYAYGVVKIFMLCKYESGKFETNIETTEIKFFERGKIPDNLAVEKCTKEQILMCFAVHENPDSPTVFD